MVGRFLNSATDSILILDMSSRVNIVEISPVNKSSPIVVTGFTGPGFIGNTALLFIARQKGFTQRAQVKSHLIPPMFLLIEGKPTPVFRIYGDQKNEILLVVSEALINAENAWPIGIKLMEWLREKGVKEIISIEGMPFGTPEGERPIFGFSSSGRDFSQIGVRPTKEGGISGLNAVLLDEAMKHNVPWTTLLVPTGLSQTIDYGGAADLIDALNRMLKLGVDTSLLRQSEGLMRKAVERARGGEQRGLLGGFRRRRPDSGA
jgi:predicted ATP-grasp superfamily ATP-dependent carboligase